MYRAQAQGPEMITSTVCGKIWALNPSGKPFTLMGWFESVRLVLNGGDADLYLHGLCDR